MDGEIIYVAGNPAGYPVEYYDTETQSYQGAIPTFLAEFAEEYGYDLRYLQPGIKDRRTELAENQQADLLSGCTAGEQYAHTTGEPVPLFSGEDGTAYTIWLTQVSSERLQADLREYADQMTQTQWTGALLEAAGQEPPARLPVGVLAGAGLVTLALLVALVASLLRLRKEKKRKVQQAQIDPESGLGTLAALEEHFSRIASDQSGGNYSLVCIHLAVDSIGWLWGYERAKELFQQGVQALRQAAEPGDILARHGADLLVLKHTADPQRTEQWGNGVLEEIRAALHGVLRPQDAAVGVYPLTEFCDLDHALFHVRQCAQEACREGQRIRLYDAGQCQSCRERWNLLDDFSKALERQEFQLYCQFFVSAGTFHVVGGEALSRWHHPQFGLLSPARYIPLLEETGQIEKLDFYGLEKACAFLQELSEQQILDFFLSCNMSRKTFGTPGFAKQCMQVVHRYRFPRKLLILEITESRQIDSRETEQMYQNIQSIRASGIRVIFDDFGTGFSSFQDLQTYSMDGLKLSKKLVDNMQTETGKQIFRTLVDIGHHMGLTILAEGVEDEGQIEMLQKLHCDALQGFRFCIPLPEEEARRRILHKDRFLNRLEL
ncbi:MAG: GGDEF domain-containing phosphodiesterase [Butyricicoccus sp.]|nr:GGDEF domain-containing phosphodiesterase [Butyricicoccus sp.]